MNYWRALLLVTAVCLVGQADAAPFAYVTDIEGTLWVIDTATNTVVATADVGRSSGLALNPAGTRLFLTNGMTPGRLRIVDTATLDLVVDIAVGNSPLGVGATATRAYVANVPDNTVSVVDLTTNSVIATIPVDLSPRAVAISPDGARVYVTNNGSDTVSVIDTATNTVSASIAVGNNPFAIGLSPDGSRAYVTNQDNAGLWVIDTSTNLVITVVAEVAQSHLTVSPDGTRIFTTRDAALANSDLLGVDTLSNTVVDTIDVGPRFTGSLDVTPDGRVYILHSAPVTLTGTVLVVDVAGGSVVATINVGRLPTAFGGAFIGGVAPLGNADIPSLDPRGLAALALAVAMVALLVLRRAGGA